MSLQNNIKQQGQSMQKSNSDTKTYSTCTLAKHQLKLNIITDIGFKLFTINIDVSPAVVEVWL